MLPPIFETGNHLRINDCLQIIVAGDSAGANLALALMSHLSHPHPNVAPIAPLVQSQQLRGLFLISPWVTFASTADSVRRNADKDYLQVAYLHVASSQYLGGQELDNYNTPLDADPKWWTALPVQAVRVVSGASEVFSDDMKKLVGKLKVSPLALPLFNCFSLTCHAGRVSRCATCRGSGRGSLPGRCECHGRIQTRSLTAGLH